MKVTKEQAQANRAHIVDTATALFRERGYDGASVADLMAAAGFTHGGFYKNFGSKADLMAETATAGLAQTEALMTRLDTPEFVDEYLSREHRDHRGAGCTIAALGGDATRQPDGVRAAFEGGIEDLVAGLSRDGTVLRDTASSDARAAAIDLLAHAVGAIVLSRSLPDDSPFADEVLSVCREQIQASLRTPDVD